MSYKFQVFFATVLVAAVIGARNPSCAQQVTANDEAQLNLAIQAAAKQRAFVYRDYRVDLSEVTQSDVEAVVRSTMHQIDIVESVQVKSGFRDFFRSIPLKVAELPKTHGVYGPQGLVLGATREISDRPVLLHELLHAVHHKMMPQGVQNADILKFYQRAKTRQAYPSESHAMKNPGEFFAMTASAFLWGKIARPPHTRERLKAAQPIYYKYLTELFGAPPNT